MKNLSPDLQHKDLHKKILAEEQKLTNLQTSTKAARSAWEDQKKQIASDTEIAIQSSREAITKATEESKATLEEINGQVNTAKQLLADINTAADKRKLELETELADIIRELKIASNTHGTLEADNRILASEIEIRKQSVDELKRVEQQLASSIAETKIQDEQAADHLVELRKQEMQLSNDIDSLNTDLEAKKIDYQREIDILESKKQALQNEIIDNRTNDERVRENLAAWQKSIDEKDANLRIREAKVAEKEKAIVRNYNLLNL